MIVHVDSPSFARCHSYSLFEAVHRFIGQFQHIVRVYEECFLGFLEACQQVSLQTHVWLGHVAASFWINYETKAMDDTRMFLFRGAILLHHRRSASVAFTRVFHVSHLFFWSI